MPWIFLVRKIQDYELYGHKGVLWDRRSTQVMLHLAGREPRSSQRTQVFTESLDPNPPWLSKMNGIKFLFTDIFQNGDYLWQLLVSSSIEMNIINFHGVFWNRLGKLTQRSSVVQICELDSLPPSHPPLPGPAMGRKCVWKDVLWKTPDYGTRQL